MRVLLVDDHPLYLEGLRNWLTVHGYDVIGVAADGLDALAHARVKRPDLVLMDLEMPGCNGLEATRLLKAELPCVVVVIMAVAFDPATVQEALNSGALDCLPKSINPDSLLRILASVSSVRDGELPDLQATSSTRPTPAPSPFTPPLTQLPLGANGKLFGKLSPDAI